MRAASNRCDLTSGSIWRSLLLFALPLLAGSLVQQLYNTVDLIFVGNFIDKSASAAVGASSLLITCLVGVFGGIGVGSGIVIAQIFGSKDIERFSRAIHNTAAMSIISGLLMMLLGYLLAPIYLRLVRTPVKMQVPGTGRGFARERCSAPQCLCCWRRQRHASVFPLESSFSAFLRGKSLLSNWDVRLSV